MIVADEGANPYTGLEIDPTVPVPVVIPGGNGDTPANSQGQPDDQ